MSGALGPTPVSVATSFGARPWRPTPVVIFSIALHALVLVAAFLQPPLWPWLLVAIVANQLLVTALGLWPRSRALGPNWTRLPAAAAARGEVAITVDDGPDPDVTPCVLAILDACGAKATFFCIATRAAQHPELVREIVRRGHAVENHGHRHSLLFALFGVRRLVADIDAAQKILGDLAGARPLFFRAPAGLRSVLLEPALCRTGLQLAAWTRRGFDTVAQDPDVVARRLLTGLAGGDILLLHDGNAARTAEGTALIVAVLPRVLEAIRAAGLRPVRLRDALTDAVTDPVADAAT